MGLKSLARSSLMRLWFGPPSVETRYGRPVAWDDAGNRVVADAITAGEPCMVSRLGSAEMGVVSFYLRWRHSRALKFTYPVPVRKVIRCNAGVFPDDDSSLDRFAELYLGALREVDVMAVWFQRGEERIITQYAPRACLIELRSLVGLLFEEPWSSALADKRVLVVHPFAATIASQYAEHRAELFADPRVLPAFELRTLAPPSTVGSATGGFQSWFDALEDTRARIGREAYDVALIGAGAYGLPLAAAIKRAGRQAVHLGGTTQLLFGIKGRRWERESQDDIVPLFNEHWVRPSADETPSDSSLVENGCYW